MTGEAADRCRLAGRGYLRPGYAADLVIFATGSVQDKATFATSNQLPAGIDRVLVNGWRWYPKAPGTAAPRAGCCAGASRDSVETDPGYISYRL